MPRRASPHPTQAELEILNVLWARGPSTVRDVHEALQATPGWRRRTSLTTTLKLLQVMTAKGLVQPDHERPAHYRALLAREKAQGGLLIDLVRRAFDGSVSNLLIRAVEDHDLSAGELRSVRRLIDKARKSKRGAK